MDDTVTRPVRRAVLYLRVSTLKQASGGDAGEGFSIPAQREACRAEAAKHGAEVVAEFVDRGESARSADRPELQRLLKRLDEGDIDFVIVHKLDRLARSRLDDVQIVLAIRNAGAQLVSVTESIDETPSGKLLHGIMATIAEFYSGNLANEARKGMLEKAKQGGTPRLAPIGYLNVRENVAGREARTVVLDPERSSLVQWAFQRYAQGDVTTRQLAYQLEERGLRSRATAKKPSSVLGHNHVHRMLTNPYYVGIILFKGVQYEGSHTPLVDPPTFQKVQDLLSAKRQGEKQRKHYHWLKTVAACGVCGSNLGMSYFKGRHGGMYPYFFCYGRQKGNGCSLPYIQRERLEDEMQRFLRRLQLSATTAEQIRARVTEHAKLMLSLNQREVTRQQQRLVMLDQQERKLLELAYAEAMSVDVIKGEQARIANERVAAQRVLTACQAEFGQIEAGLDQALEMAVTCSRAYDEAKPQEKRQLLNALFDKLYVTPDGVIGVDLSEPFAQLLTGDLEERLARELDGAQRDARPSVYLREDEEARVRRLLASINWDPLERPEGLLPWEAPNPEAYAAARGSRKTVLVGEGGLEPPCPKTHGPEKCPGVSGRSTPSRSSALTCGNRSRTVPLVPSCLGGFPLRCVRSVSALAGPSTTLCTGR